MEEKFKKAGFTRGTSYEFFILMVSLLSFVNLVLITLPISGEANEVILIIDFLISILFLTDFITRLFGSNNKKQYFVKEYGWADLLASIPLASFNIFRIFRVVRFVRVSRVLGVKLMGKMLSKSVADTALYFIMFLILILLEFGSIAILAAERSSVDANILNASDALWWVMVTIATVGYGDFYPVSNVGRLVGAVVIITGVGLFGVVTGYLANLFLGNKSSAKE